MTEPIKVQKDGVVMYDKGAKDCKGDVLAVDCPSTGLRTFTCSGCSLHWTQPIPQPKRR